MPQRSRGLAASQPNGYLWPNDVEGGFTLRDPSFRNHHDT